MWARVDVRLALEVLHNIQKNIVNIRAVIELDFYCVEVAKRIRDIKLTISSAIHILQRRQRSWLDVILPFCRGRLAWGYDGCGRRNARSVSGGIW